MRKTSFKTKLRILVLTTCSLVLVLVSGVFITDKIITFRDNLISSTLTLARVTGTNTSAALTFDDPDTAVEVLAALRGVPEIRQARILTQDGLPFASYEVPGPNPPAPPLVSPQPNAPTERHAFSSDALDVISPIMLRDKCIGAVFLRAELSGLHDRIRSGILISAGIALLCLLLALAVSDRMQTSITSPIFHLGRVMRDVSESKRFDLRATKTHDDEIGELIDGFNSMLGQIQDRDGRLALALREAREARQEAEAANNIKSEFLANMSHELRTPLNHILGFTQLILSRRFGPLSPLQEEYLSDALTSGKHLLDLINDILDLSKVEAGKMELDLHPVDFRTLFANSLVLIKERSLSHGITLKEELDLPIERGLLDERKVKQVLYNLFSNAAKFTPDGGAITLRARQCPVQEAARLAGQDLKSVERRHEGNWMLVGVEDTGQGLRNEDLERIFDAFTQTEAGARHTGTGLGLPLARSFTALHGGHLWAQSAGPGQGSTFWLTLPVRPAPEEKV